MLTYERQMEILEILKKDRVATVESLSRRLYASGATIRRDLSDMESRGLLLRIRGGASSIESGGADAPLFLRSKKEIEKKKTIARLAAPLLREKSIFFLDSSSTVTALAPAFEKYRDKIIMTNGLVSANTLSESSQNKVYLSGGRILSGSAVIGESALEMIRRFRADLFLFSCCGFDPGGTTEAEEEIAVIKQTMAANAREKILLCDSTKFGSSYFCRAVSAPEIDLVITDCKPPEEFLTSSLHFLYP